MGLLDHLVAARALMGISLAFHIVYAATGVGIPLLLFIAEGLALKTGESDYRRLAMRWSDVAALLLAIGAGSGTILSFELGLLWPTFMGFAGAVIGMPFSLEGFAFFTEAIFLALYIFGWRALPPIWHWLTAVPVILGAALSAVFVISANAWMNTPAGFRIENGKPVDVDVWRAIMNPAFPTEAVHGTLASYVATSFAVAGVYAIALLRSRRRRDASADSYNWRALRISMAVGAIVIPLQILSGDVAARFLAAHEPEKFAAMETIYRTEGHAPITIGGIPDPGAQETRYAIEIPSALSLLVYGDPSAVLRGLSSFSSDAIPDPLLVHLPFDIMVGSGFTLAGLASAHWLLAGLSRLRRRTYPQILLLVLAAASPLGFLALESGWLVTEFGRQPWIVHGLIRTSAAVTPRSGTTVLLLLFLLIYLALTAGLALLLLRQWREPREAAVSASTRIGRVNDARG